MIATRVILRGPKTTLDELAAFVAEARSRGVDGDAAIQFRGATGLGAFAAFSVDVPASPAVLDQTEVCASTFATETAGVVPCQRPADHPDPDRTADDSFSWLGEPGDEFGGTDMRGDPA